MYLFFSLHKLYISLNECLFRWNARVLFFLQKQKDILPFKVFLWWIYYLEQDLILICEYIASKMVISFLWLKWHIPIIIVLLLVEIYIHNNFSMSVLFCDWYCINFIFNLILQVFPIEHLKIFTEEELERLFCGERDFLAVCISIILLVLACGSIQTSGTKL